MGERSEIYEREAKIGDRRLNCMHTGRWSRVAIESGPNVWDSNSRTSILKNAGCPNDQEKETS